MKATIGFLKELSSSCVFMIIGLYMVMSFYRIAHLFGVEVVLFVCMITAVALGVEKTYIAVRDYEKEKED